MRSQSLLNLLVINDDQLYAERLVQLLSPYYDSVNLGFLDDKEELLKLLRQPWDVLVSDWFCCLSVPLLAVFDVIVIYGASCLLVPKGCNVQDAYQS